MAFADAILELRKDVEMVDGSIHQTMDVIEVAAKNIVNTLDESFERKASEDLTVKEREMERTALFEKIADSLSNLAPSAPTQVDEEKSGGLASLAKLIPVLPVLSKVGIGLISGAAMAALAMFLPKDSVIKGIILAPVNAVLGGIKGFKEGYAKDGIAGGIVGALGGALDGFYSWVPKLAKKVLTFFGLPEDHGMIKALENFNFKETFTKFFLTDIPNAVESVYNTITDWVDDIKAGYDVLGDMLIKALRNIPVVNKILGIDGMQTADEIREEELAKSQSTVDKMDVKRENEQKLIESGEASARATKIDIIRRKAELAQERKDAELRAAKAPKTVPAGAGAFMGMGGMGSPVIVNRVTNNNVDNSSNNTINRRSTTMIAPTQRRGNR